MIKQSEIRWTTLTELMQDDSALQCDAPVVAVLPWVNQSAAADAAELMISRAAAPLSVIAVQDDVGAGPNVIWNRGLALTRCEYFIYCAEDALVGRYWLKFALQAMSNGAGLLGFNDGKWFGQLAAFGMVRCSWIKEVYGGALFYPKYRQHYGDVELSLIARQQDTFAYHAHALMMEIDYKKDKKRVHADDRAVFMHRMRNGFDGRVTDQKLLELFS